MTPPLSVNWPVVAFGDLEQEIWGVAVGGPAPRLAIGGLAAPELVAFIPASIELGDPDGDWFLSGEGCSVRVSSEDRGTVVLGRASGTIAGGVEREFDAGCLRCAELPGTVVDSIRVVGAWFDPGQGVALLASRPRGAESQDRDEIAATVVGEDPPAQVLDPRLSTTYDGDRGVLRVGLELWLGAGEGTEQYPRRVAGEWSGPRASEAVAGVSVEACALRCYSRAGQGAGVHILVAPA